MTRFSPSPKWRPGAVEELAKIAEIAKIDD
jgi:hypothetical protein